MLRKIKYIPSYVRGMYIKPAKRRLTKWKTLYLKYGQVKKRNTYILPDSGEEYSNEIKNLEKDGFASLKNSNYQGIIVQLQEFIRNLNINDCKLEQNKTFWHRPLRGKKIYNDHFLVTFALDKSFLLIAQKYLGCFPLLNSVQIIRSVNDQSGEYKKSQLWHQDHDDDRMLKLFVYLSDVVEKNDGPVDYYNAIQTRDMNLRYSPIHKQDEEIKIKSGGLKHTPIFGNSGEIFMIDTKRCLHRGSRINSKRDRVVYVATYTSCARLVPTKQEIIIREDAPDFQRAILGPIDI